MGNRHVQNQRIFKQQTAHLCGLYYLPGEPRYSHISPLMQQATKTMSLPPLRSTSDPKNYRFFLNCGCVFYSMFVFIHALYGYSLLLIYISTIFSLFPFIFVYNPLKKIQARYYTCFPFILAISLVYHLVVCFFLIIFLYVLCLLVQTCFGVLSFSYLPYQHISIL